MKKIFFLIIMALVAFNGYSQAPGIFNYQGVARNSVGNVLVNQSITLRLTIHDNTAAGPVVYQESRSVITNPFGLFNVQVGSPGASPVIGTIAGVNWALGSKYIQVEIDPNGGTSFINIGTAQMVSVPYSIFAQNAGDIVLPFNKSQNDAGMLFTITNTGNGAGSGAIAGFTNSTASNAYAITGTVTSTTPGGFSAGLRGINNGTGGLGIGVYGSQAGSGWGVYGTTPGGVGVHGNSNTGFGVYGLSTSGVGVYGTSTNSVSGRFEITTNTNTSNALEAATNGSGSAILGNRSSTTGTSAAVTGISASTDANAMGVLGVISSTAPGGFSAGLRGLNSGTGGLGIGVYGSQAGNGWGVYGTTPGGIGVYGNSSSGFGLYGLSTSGTGLYATSTTGQPGVFEITNNVNTANALSALTNGTGWAAQFSSTNGTPRALRTIGGLQFTGINEAANRVLTSDASGNATWQALAAASDLTLPFDKTQAENGFLFRLTNSGDGSAIEGVTNSTISNAFAIRGTVSSTSPGGFSSGLRGLNNGTGGLGVGVYGSQAGSGWGVYGVTPNGLGVYGNSSAGGFGVYANSNTGTGLQATSNNGVAASFDIFNNANNNNAIAASSVGNGTVINVTTSGSGAGVRSSTGVGFALHGITTAISSAGLVADNNGGGEGVVGRVTSDIAGSVVGRNDGGGYGVRGFIATNNSGTGIGVFGQIGLNNSTGRAGRFENLNSVNTVGNTFEVETNGNGNIPDNKQGNASSFLVNNTNSVAAGVRSEVKTIFGNFGAAGIFGVSSGTGGFAGLFHSSNTSGNGATLVSITDGNGNAITANAGKDGNAVEANIDGAGNAIYGWVPSFATGRAARFSIFNDVNTSDVVTATTVGNGIAGNFFVNKTTGTSPAVRGEVNSIFSNFGTAGVYGISSGTGGFAGLFHASNPAGNGAALVAIADGNGNGVTANASNTGDGVETTADGTGNSLYAWKPNFADGRAGRFANFNTANVSEVVSVEQHSAANIIVFKQGNPGVVNVARIDASGRGFFNNGTQVGGADVAEMFDVNGSATEFEAGDILIISTSKDRAVEKSSTPYSTLVAGVYATKPGVVMTEEHIDTDLSGQVPMGVIGVIPTKVCIEGGAIKRGDMLVTSSLAGVAMKADPDKVKPGQVLGKALQDFDGTGIGKIKVLVSVK